MFLAACEGYFDKENERSALVRIQTLFIINAFGAKKKGGGDLSLTDLWSLLGEEKQTAKTFTWGDDIVEFRKQIEKAHGIRLS